MRIILLPVSALLGLFVSPLPANDLNNTKHSLHSGNKSMSSPSVAPSSKAGDTEEIIQLIMRERQGRDHHWWTQMQNAFWPEATVHLSWINGPAAEFVERSRQIAERGSNVTHRLSLPAVHVGENRGVLEVPVTIQLQMVVNGVEANMSSYLRLIYLVEKRQNRWGIMRIDGIYEFDTLTPSVPGQELKLPYDELKSYRRSYRFLSYTNTIKNIPVFDNLYGTDRPDDIKKLYESSFKWAGIDNPDL